MIKTIKERKWKSPITYINLFVFTFQFVFSVLIIIFLFIFLTHFIGKLYGENRYFESNVRIIFVVGLIWIYTFDFIMIRFFNKNNNAKNMSRLLVIFMFSVGLITINNLEKANNIKKGKPDYNVAFECNDISIKTNSNLVFVGLTENYLFLRDIKQKKKNILA